MGPEMSPQNGLVGVQSVPELTSSNSFRVDYRPEVTRQEMGKDIKSYLFEFRLQAQKYDYDLSLSLQNGSWRLGDSDRGEPMTTKAHRAILERKLHGEPTHREEAEFAGLTFLEQQLGVAQIGDSIIWFSPSGPRDQGYSQEYGFGFTGKVIGSANNKKGIGMTVNRLEKPTLEQFNEAFRLLAGQGFRGQTADDFIRMPVVIKGGLQDEYIESVLARTFGFVYDPVEAEKNDQIYGTRLKHLADEFIANYANMSSAERIRSIHAMENIATEAKKIGASQMIIYENMNLEVARTVYGQYEPEKVLGSCPVVSNNPLSAGAYGEIFGSGVIFKLPPDEYGSREVLCPACGEICIRPKGKLLDACTNGKCSNPGAIACKPERMN